MSMSIMQECYFYKSKMLVSKYILCTQLKRGIWNISNIYFGERSGDLRTVAYTGILFWGEGNQQIQLKTEDKENGDLEGGSPLVRGSGGSCNFVQEISFHIEKFS